MDTMEQGARENLLRSIAGEITLAENPGRIMRKWREQFSVAQHELADQLKISPSVISDYESGRRKSPRIDTIRKFAESLIMIDENRGGQIVKAFIRLLGQEIPSDILLDIREFPSAIPTKLLTDHLECKIIVKDIIPDREIFGYTTIDSLRAILQLSPEQMIKLYGATPNRAAIFTHVSTGRSPMVAIRTSQMGLGPAVRPSVVILHGLKKVDPVACKIAEVEKIPLYLSPLKKTEDLVRKLRNFNPGV
ncbi:MAG: helix-turn-helix domain-containing protein [Candidatus Thorarchaeota archaeon]